MNISGINRMIEETLKEKGKYKLWKQIIGCFAAIVVFAVAYMLILPAVTLENQPICGMEEHTHQLESCYEISRELVCGLEESEEHSHDDSCYEEVCELVCDMDEHIHNDDCYEHEEETVEEAAEETTEEPYFDKADETVMDISSIFSDSEDDYIFEDEGEDVEIFGIREDVASGGGIETENGTDLENGLLTTDDVTSGEGLDIVIAEKSSEATVEVITEETTENLQDKSAEYLCGMEEHIHSEECYDENGELVCGKEEHKHDDSCFGGGIMLLSNDEELTLNNNSYNFEMNGDGFYTLTITGGAPIPERLMEEEGFSKYKELLTKVNINTKVGSFTYIGAYAFSGCQNLREVNVAKESYISSIYAGAFSNCINLEKFQFENCGGHMALQIEGGTSAENGAFYNTGLKEAVFPANISKLGNYAFADCKKLERVVFQNSNSYGLNLQDGAFYACTALESVNLEALSGTITNGNKLDNRVGVFEDCTSLKSVTLPSKFYLMSTNDYSRFFYNCRALQSVTFNENNTNSINGCYIPDYMFYGCSSLEEVDLTPLKNITYIGSNAFRSSAGYPYNGLGVKKVTVPKTVTEFKGNAFSDNKSLKEIAFEEGSSLKTIRSWCFVNDTSLKIIDLSTLTELQTIEGNAFGSCTGLQNLVIPKNVTTIGNNAFEKCTGLQSFKLNAASLSSVGSNLFINNSNNFTMIIGNEVNSLKAAFLNCAAENINKLVFEGENEFELDEKVETKLTSPLDVLAAGKYYVSAEGDLYYIDSSNNNAALIYKAESSNTEFTVPSYVGIDGDISVTGISNYAFKGSGLTAIDFTDVAAITSVGEYAFAEAAALSSVGGKTTVEEAKTIFTGCTEVTDNAFYNTNLEGAKSDKEDDVNIGGELITGTLTSGGFDVNNQKGSLLTGETETVNVNFSTDNDDSVYRLYFYCTEKSADELKKCEFNKEIVEYNGFSVTYHKVMDKEGIYYYEIYPTGSGGTLSMPLEFKYPNGSANGERLTLWVVKGNKELFVDGEDFDGAAIMPDSDVSNTPGISVNGKYLQTEWKTEAFNYPVKKISNTINNKATNFALTTDGLCGISDLTWWVHLDNDNEPGKSHFNTEKTTGSDYVTYVDFKDTLTLPTDVTLREGIIEAVENGNWRTNITDKMAEYYVTVDNKEYLFAKAGNENNSYLLITKAGIELNEAKNNVVLTWRNENRNNGQKEITNLSTNVIYGSEVLIYNKKLSDDSGVSLKFVNDVTAVENYQFAESYTSTTTAEVTKTIAASGSLNLKKERTNEDEMHGTDNDKYYYFGEDVSYKITAENPSPYSYDDIGCICDVLDKNHYIKPENIMAMFNEAEEAGDTMSIEIINAVLVSDNAGNEVVAINSRDKVNTSAADSGEDTEYYSIPKQNDDNQETNTAKLVLEKKDGVLTLTKTVGEETVNFIIGENGYTDIEAAFESIGFINTAENQYKIYWNKDSVDGGEKKEYNVYASFKDSFMLLNTDMLGNYAYGRTEDITKFRLETNNTAYAYSDNGTVLKNAAPNSVNIAPEIQVAKSFLSNNTEYKDARDGVEIADKSIYDYRVILSHTGSCSYSVLPIVDRLQGAQAVIVSKDENKDADWAGKAKTYKASDGTEWYILIPPNGFSGNGSAEYTFKGVWVGGYYADSITVTQDKNGVKTIIKWYLKNTAANYFTMTLKYHVVADRDLLGYDPTAMFYSTENYVFINDRESHRIYDYCRGSNFFISFNKYIVTEKGEERVLDKLDDDGFSRITQTDPEVTYRLDFYYNSANAGGTLKGKDFYDALPKNAGFFSWDKAKNISVSYTVEGGQLYLGSNEMAVGESSGAEFSVTNIDPYTNTSHEENQQYLKWDDSFKCVFEAQGHLYIYVTLTFPGKDNPQEWEEYINKHGTDKLYNTLYEYNFPKSVSHQLTDPGKAFLQKGVYETGMYTERTGTNYWGSTLHTTGTYYRGKDRLTYNSTTDTEFNNGSVAYYILIKNSSNVNLYLTPVYDILPKGFTFYSLRNNVDGGDGGTTNDNSWTAVGNVNDVRPTKVAITDGWRERIASAANGTSSWNTNNTVELTETTLVNGQQRLKFEINLDGDEQKDENGYYLKPGQWLQFGYEVYVGTDAENEEIGLNSAAMRIVDLGQSFTVDNDTKVNVSTKWNKAAPNDGSRELWNNDEAKQNGFEYEEGNNDTMWLASEVNVYRGGEVIPGITKSADDDNIDKDQVVNWTVTSYNDGTKALSNYVIEDVLDAPQHFTGNVTYEAYSGNDFVITNINSGSHYVAHNDGDYLFTVTRNTSSDGEDEITIRSNTNMACIFNENNYGEYKDITFKIKHEDLVTSVPAEISFNKEADKETIRIKFEDPKWAILANGYMKLTFESKNTTGVYTANPAIYNTSTIIPTDKSYDGGKVAKGDNIVENGGNYGVRAMACISSDISVVTTSVNKIAESGNETNSAFSNKGTNYIMIKDKSKTLNYTLTVNSADNMGMDKLVLIDNLPQVGDLNTISNNVERGSQFKINFDKNPNFKVVLTNADGNEEVLDSSKYTIQYSTKTDNFSKDVDWTGENSADWTTYNGSNDDLSNARSVRLIIGKDGEEQIIKAGYTVSFSYNAVIDNPDDAKAGTTAWNTFGYQYEFTDDDKTISLYAAPLRVGVRIPVSPNLVKKLINSAGAAVSATEAADFEYVIYTGNKISFTDYSAETVGNALMDDNREFTYVKLSFEKGKETSMMQSLSADTADGLHKYSYTPEDGFAKTDDLWVWDFNTAENNNGTVTINTVDYNIVELSPKEKSDFSYHSSYDGSKTINDRNFSFTYNPTSNITLEYANVRKDWEVRVVKLDTEQNTLPGALFGLYSLNSKDALSETEVVNNRVDTAEMKITTKDNTIYYLSKLVSSDSNGSIELKGLSGNSYIIKELIPPEGYYIDKYAKDYTEYWVVNYEDYHKYGKAQVITVKNVAAGVLPETGGSGVGNMLRLIGGLVMVIAVGYFILYRKKSLINK